MRNEVSLIVQHFSLRHNITKLLTVSHASQKYDANCSCKTDSEVYAFTVCATKLVLVTRLPVVANELFAVGDARSTASSRSRPMLDWTGHWRRSTSVDHLAPRSAYVLHHGWGKRLRLIACCNNCVSPYQALPNHIYGMVSLVVS